MDTCLETAACIATAQAMLITGSGLSIGLFGVDGSHSFFLLSSFLLTFTVLYSKEAIYQG